MPPRKFASPPKPPSGALPIAAVLSFLKQTRGLLTWSLADLRKSLLITAQEAHQVIAALALQGYIRPVEDNPKQWLTTLHGEAVSGSKPPRFTQESVEKALSSLRERIDEANKDSTSLYTVVEAVAFGDFLDGRPQVQAPEAGLRLVARRPGGQQTVSGAKRKREFLKKLRARDLRLELLPYEAWMSARSHRSLLATRAVHGQPLTAKVTRKSP